MLAPINYFIVSDYSSIPPSFVLFKTVRLFLAHPRPPPPPPPRNAAFETRVAEPAEILVALKLRGN